MKIYSHDPTYGTIREQVNSRIEYAIEALEAYDFRCKRQYLTEIVRECGGPRGFKSAVAKTKKLLDETHQDLRRSP